MTEALALIALALMALAGWQWKRADRLARRDNDKRAVRAAEARRKAIDDDLQGELDLVDRARKSGVVYRAGKATDK